MSFRLLGAAITIAICMLLGLQVTYGCYIRNWLNNDWSVIMADLPVFDFRYFFYDSTTKTFFMFLVIASLLFLAWVVSSAWRIGHGKDGKSYSRLIHTWQRKRGTRRVQYNMKGEITRFTLEVALEYLFYPLLWLENQFCKQFWLPDRFRWNMPRSATIQGVKRMNSGGIPVIAVRQFWLFGKYNKVYYLTGDHHSLFLGMTGRGKSETFVKSMLHSYITAGESMVVHDPKPELYAATKYYLDKEDYQTFILNFDKPSNGDCWNPLTLPWLRWKEAIAKAREKNPKADWQSANMSLPTELILDICHIICWEEDQRNQFWWQGAASMMAGAILFLFEEGREEWINFKSVKYLFLLGDDNDKPRQTTLFKYITQFRPKDAGSRSKMESYFNAEGPTRATLKAVYEAKIQMLTATEDIMRMTSSNTFDIRDVFKKKTAIFLQTQEEKSTYYPLVVMFLKQLYEVGIKTTKEADEAKRLDIPMNWVIDEFALLPEIKDIEPMISAGRSRGIRMNLFCQSPDQLKNRYQQSYGAIMDNCTNIIYLGSGTEETKHFFVERAGKKQVWDKQAKKYVEKDVITSERLNLFEKGRMLFTTVEWNPYVGRVAPFFAMSYACDPIWKDKKNDAPKPEFIDVVELAKNKAIDFYKEEGIDVEDPNDPDDEYDVTPEQLENEVFEQFAAAS